MRTINAIVFDLGGVLVELSGVNTMLRWSALNLNEEGLWQRWLHSPTVRAFETGVINADQFAEQLVVEMQLQVEPQEFLDAFVAWPTGLFDGVPELLTKLRQDFSLACLSNTNALHWPRLMEEMQLASHLDHSFGSHLLGKIKPDHDIYEHLIDKLSVAPNSILFFDDHALNVNAAQSLGIQAVHARGVTEVIEYLRNSGLTSD